jgi:hypothetical protein
MLGEQVTEATVGERGLEGDRAFALVDPATGKVVSAKNPRKWGAMFTFRANLAAPGDVRVTLPSGEVVSLPGEGALASIGKALGAPIQVANQPEEGAAYEAYYPDLDGLSHRNTTADQVMGMGAPGTFFDFSAVHFVTTATLAYLATRSPGSDFDVRRFRPNIVIETPPGTAPFIENTWLGKTVVAGGVELRTLIAAPRCVMTTLAQPGLAADTDILRTVARENMVDFGGSFGKMACVGAYAAVAAGGVLRTGGAVEVRG